MDQLRDGGILSSHIRYHASCTFDDDRLFSHRADATTNRRMFGVIMLT
jgi:copper oxidase (laccase) domain-containing protein